VGRLFLRIFLSFWLGSTVLLLGLAAGLWIIQPDILTSFRYIMENGMLRVGSQAASLYEANGQDGAATVLGDVRREGGVQAWLYATDGKLLAGADEVSNAQDLVARAVVNEEAERPGMTRFRPALFARRVASSSGRPYIFIWEGPLRLSQFASPTLLSIRFLIVVLAGGIFCWWFTWRITRPIRILRTTTGRVAQGDLAARIGNNPEFHRGDELFELARDFDYMAARMELLMKSQQQLLADISHELRSPLARLSLALDLAKRRLGEGVSEHQRMEREIQRLNELIEQLLTLARLQAQSKEPESESVDVRDLVYEVAADASFEAEAAGRKVVVSRTCNGNIQGNRALLRSALENVVRNAVRHTPVSSEVTIEMERVNGADPQAHRLRIGVQDHGPGVPVPALDRLFDPFFRVDEGRDRKSGGVGLGLAITRQAMRAHGGTATAQNLSNGGLLIRLELPVE
jgi:two-component system sensor histidine kinase CpxA